MSTLAPRLWVLVAALVLTVAPWSRAFGQTLGVPETACESENFLGRRNLSGAASFRGDLGGLTDGAIAPEGAPWPPSDLVQTIRQPVVWDLGAERALSAFALQADADQAVALDVSQDGQTWASMRIPAHPTASGMITRAVRLGSRPARYVRVSPPPDGGGVLTVSEVAVGCGSAPPIAAWRIREDAIPRELGASGVTHWTTQWVTASRVRAIKGVLAILLIGGIALDWARRRTGRRSASPDESPPAPNPPRSPSRNARGKNLFLAAIAVPAFFAYYNFGAYHYPAFIHSHDVFHYFVGAKYFPELAYERLYLCAAVAEAEAGFPQRVELRAHRDLATNELINGTDVIARASECHARFAPERWNAFARDVRYFANADTVENWNEALKDHGFNGSPAWLAVGASIANRLPADDWSIGRSTSMFTGVTGLLDPALLAVSLAAVAWAFGWPMAAVAVVVFACNPLCKFEWIGGGFLRDLWLCCLTVGVCLLRRQRWLLAGGFLALASLLQLFPAICLVAVGARGALTRIRGGRLPRAVSRILVGAALVVGIVAPLSAAMTRCAACPNPWMSFARNTSKHASTPSANLVGLQTALSYRPSTRSAVLFQGTEVDPFVRVRAARRENYVPLRWVHIVGLGALLCVVGLGLRKNRPWWWTAAASLCIVTCAVQTSSYYTSWLTVMALVGFRRSERILPIVTALAACLVLESIFDQPDDFHAAASVLLVCSVYAVGAMDASWEGRSAVASATRV